MDNSQIDYVVINVEGFDLQRLGHKMTSPQSAKSGTKVQVRNGDAPNAKTNTSSSSMTSSQREKQKAEREGLTLWRRPITTIKYASIEIWLLLQTYGRKTIENKRTVIALLAILLSILALFHIQGPHQPLMQVIRARIWFITYWTGLGVLSSVGLGTGLHTFLLYLGPHIAAVTIAAYECGALNFPEPPYPEEIVCPLVLDPNNLTSVWNIMSKVRFEAFLWGAGTALGELPPYFMARAARLSGYDPADAEDLAEFEELQRMKQDGSNLNLVQRAKLGIERLVEKVGFFGILACASIPNPLFDLAGITCGHFLVPFWTFFGATLIGKAVFKMHFQKLFVILVFNEALVGKAVRLLQFIPLIGTKLQEPFLNYLEAQKRSLHRKTSDQVPESGHNFLSSLFEMFVIVMILYFIVSIVNSLAQSYHKRIHKKQAPRRKVARD